jgi:transposase
VKGLSELGVVYLHREPVDFRKSINGLAVIVEQQMDLSPYMDAVFVFCNRRRDKLKVLYWDKTGFCLWYKRLEQDKFKWPRKLSFEVIELTAEQFDWLLRGLDILKLQAHKSRGYNELS